MRYRKRPLTIDAWQFTKHNYKEEVILNFVRESPDVFLFSESNGDFIGGEIKTLEGFLDVSENDYIIKGIQGEFYPCKPDIFEKTYELIED